MQSKIIRNLTNNFSISIDEINRLAKRYELIEISVELKGIQSDPTTIYENVAGYYDAGFILDFGKPGEKDPYVSYMSHEIMKIITINDENPAEKLRSYLNNISIFLSDKTRGFAFGAVGYFGYEAFKYFEPSVGSLKKDPNNCPEAAFMIPKSMISFMHSQKRIIISTIIETKGSDLEQNYLTGTDKLKFLEWLVINTPPLRKVERKIGCSSNNGFENVRFKPNMEKNDYISMIKKAKNHILNGELIQCVLSQRFLLKTCFDNKKGNSDKNDFIGTDLYKHLRKYNPSEYMYFFNFGNDFMITGSSPEMFLKVENNKVIIRPVAGTTGIDKNEDFSVKLLGLKTSEKDKAEHMMLVDLARNDLGRVCESGTVKVSELMSIEVYSHVAHIVSEIVGIMKSDYDCFDAFVAAFPTGTLVGAPKIRAAQLISELEPVGRGPYCGAMGWFDVRGNLDTGTIIRSAIIKDKKISYNGGGGIVFDSNPELEYQETLDKTKIFYEYIK